MAKWRALAKRWTLLTAILAACPPLVSTATTPESTSVARTQEQSSTTRPDPVSTPECNANSSRTTQPTAAIDNVTVAATEQRKAATSWGPACDEKLEQDGSRLMSNITWDDATWIMTSSFIIFTMQSGFGLLESGSCSFKNEVNVMMKNAVDVVFGGISFWVFGFGVAFDDATRRDEDKNPFAGIGPFFVDADDDHMGYIFSCFIFQLSFATTATTIVSGAMAERTKLGSYIVFSFLNTAIFCFPAYWIWAPHGFLRRMGALDIAGAGAVHLVGGSSGLVATMMLGPRHGRFDQGEAPPMGCPTNALLGMFMLWWGWLGFNCGSTFGISGGKWKLAARSAVATVVSSMGGGCIGLLGSFIFKKRKFYVDDLVNGILGSLVSITAMCALAHPWESLVIGMVGGALCVVTPRFLDKLHVDDPVGVIPVHGVSAIWGMLSVGLFVDEDTIECITEGRRGAFRGGGFYLLGVQALSCVCIASWSLITSFILLKIIDLTLGLRVSLEDELLGGDLTEHGITFHQPLSLPEPTQNGGTKVKDTPTQQDLDLKGRSSAWMTNQELVDSAAAADDSVLCAYRARQLRLGLPGVAYARRPSLGLRHPSYPDVRSLENGSGCPAPQLTPDSLRERRSNLNYREPEFYINEAMDSHISNISIQV